MNDRLTSRDIPEVGRGCHFLMKTSYKEKFEKHTFLKWDPLPIRRLQSEIRKHKSDIDSSVHCALFRVDASANYTIMVKLK